MLLRSLSLRTATDRIKSLIFRRQYCTVYMIVQNEKIPLEMHTWNFLSRSQNAHQDFFHASPPTGVQNIPGCLRVQNSSHVPNKSLKHQAKTSHIANKLKIDHIKKGLRTNPWGNLDFFELHVWRVLCFVLVSIISLSELTNLNLPRSNFFWTKWHLVIRFGNHLSTFLHTCRSSK